jgi:uncharacterized protein
MRSSFLTAEWRKLILINYPVDVELLKPFIPAKTEFDLWDNTCYVSLVGFMFLNTRLKGISIPFHKNFPEVNLRFYVKFKDALEWKRGVVFIKEIVPRAALTFVANTVYNENYETLSMKSAVQSNEELLKVSYGWKKSRWHTIWAEANLNSVPIIEGSEQEFITEHFWGYTKLNNAATSEYQVEHPRWDIYPIRDYAIDVDFGLVYGKIFDFLRTEKPKSVFLAEGSEIIVRSGRKI